MPFHVSLQTRLVRKHIEAHVAREHFHALVYFAMMRELHGCGERLSAHLTYERLPFVMISSMHNVLIFEGEYLATYLA